MNSSSFLPSFTFPTVHNFFHCAGVDMVGTYIDSLLSLATEAECRSLPAIRASSYSKLSPSLLKLVHRNASFAITSAGVGKY
jgi:hypothetical protein